MFSLFFAVAGIPLGRLVDRTNRRNLLVFGIVAWSMMTVCCGLASNFLELFAARLGVGVARACSRDPAFEEKFFDIPQAQRKPNIHERHQPDHLRG